jgi:hypothetical protein
MRTSPLKDLQPLNKGMTLLARHPLQVLTLAILSVLLSFLGPVLQIWAPVPEGAYVMMTLAIVSLLPLELYFLPRYILALDAEALDHPANPKDSWQATFEARWMRAFLAKALLYLVVAAGTTCLVFPGLFLLATFGWMPLRVLVRGESIQEAAKGSALLMARHWPKVLLPVVIVMGVYFLGLYGAMLIQDHVLPDPVTPWIQLTHPAVWGIDFGGALLNLWISVTFLAVYHRLELCGPSPEPPASD